MSSIYDVTLSFAGDDRAIARVIATYLKDEGFSVFYDAFATSELWGSDLFETFQRIYQESRVCILVLSKACTSKQWTTFELRGLIAHSRHRESFTLIPVRVDNAPLQDGLRDLVVLDWSPSVLPALGRVVRETLAKLPQPEPEVLHKNVHVVRRFSGGWSVRREGASRATRASYRNRFRGLLHDLFSHAVAEGHRDDNPVSGTLKADEVVVRRRLTMAEYEKIYDAADPWFKLALDVAIVTLQRREDLAALTTSDFRDGFLWVTQHKTGRRLRIKYAGTKLQPLLQPLIQASDPGRDSIHESSVVPSVRLIRKPKGRARRGVSGEVLTREFSSLRSLHIGPRTPEDPTFHEIRALGARHYEDQGMDPQQLLGHADSRMTRWYLDRHKIQWVDVELPATFRENFAKILPHVSEQCVSA